MKYSTTWKSSAKPKKQRKYLYNAPLHIRGKMLKAHLSETLSKKFNKRSVRIRVGDKVRIMKGQFLGKEGKVEKIDTKNRKAIIENVSITKTDGSKIKVPIAIPNLMIIDLNMKDKKRLEILKRK